MANSPSTLELTQDKHILCSVAVAAIQIGMTEQPLREWMKRHGVEKQGKKVDLANLLTARRESFETDETKKSDAERKTKAEAELKEEQAKQAAMVTAHMEGAIIYMDAALEAFTSLFAEIQAKCISHDNTLESDLLLDGIPQETVNAIMRKQRERTNTMLTEFADGQSTLTSAVAGKPKRRYIKSEKSVPTAATGNRKRVGRPQ